MKHTIQYSSEFKSQFKRVKKNPRWVPVFNGKVSFDEQGRSPWDYVMSCFIQRKKIPAYFYAHPLHIPQSLRQQIKRRASSAIDTAKIQVLELHLDGHNGDHLLAYYDDEAVTYLLKIGTHSDLFG